MLPSISVLIPAYNEEACIESTVRAVVDCLSAYQIPYEIIILNDGSSDGTEHVIAFLLTRFPSVIRMLRHDTNQGIARTYEDLYCAARMEYVVDFAADGQVDPHILQKMLPLIPEHDMIICRRTETHYGWMRTFVSYCFRLLPRLLFGIDTIDPGCAKLQRKEIVNIPLISNGVFREAERIIRAKKHGYRIGSVDIVAHPAGNNSGANVRLVLVGLFDMLKLYFYLVILPRITPSSR
ncbi:hypothetical protein AUJ46_00985 [Candidatus Peregrinibacteria bacterium CG1_02_54_53]|nr:MAG: hypothetical protein AUJ46_00985 [Candidatus Peregrinibacteria bacterium CG1_02_54_53]